MEEDRFTIIKPKEHHSASFIFLHGLGDCGDGIKTWMESVGFKPLPYVKYIFPTAPLAPNTVNNGRLMHSWFDVFAFRPLASQNEAEVECSALLLDRIIQSELREGISEKRIMIGGLSQGGAVSLHWALSRNTKLAGIVALSTWRATSVAGTNFSGNPENKVFIGHGSSDKLIDLLWAKQGLDLIRQLFPLNTYRVYEGLTHDLCCEEMVDVQEFIKVCIPPETDITDSSPVNFEELA